MNDWGPISREFASKQAESFLMLAPRLIIPGLSNVESSRCFSIQKTATLRISARDLQAAIKRESQIYLPLFGHSHILNKQVLQAVACHHFHNIDQRLALWLLLVRDRTRDGAFNITHEAIAHILGVSRSGVSSAAGLLQTKGLIHYARGRITPSRSWRARSAFLRMLPNP